jgi:triosephosphate isomerase
MAGDGHQEADPGAGPLLPTRLAGINLKMYFGAMQTRDWLAAVVHELPRHVVQAAGVFVLPPLPMLESAAAALAGTGIAWGAQNVAGSSRGDQTGETSAQLLRELGCSYVLVGHAERRAHFEENDEVVAAKVAQAADHGLVPVICVGERRRVPASAAAACCRHQASVAVGASAGQPMVIAYEPVWSIGGSEPAPAAHVREVCAAISELADWSGLDVRVIYGGSAGPGTFSRLEGAVDGLLLGRFAHNPRHFCAVANEIGQPRQPTGAALAGKATRSEVVTDEAIP